jgi:GNAT superfamily N-acetyltransferase
MTTIPNSMVVGKATKDHVVEVSNLLCEAAEWMGRHRKPLWSPAKLGPAFVEPLVERGEIIASWRDARIVGVMTIQWSDREFWPDHDDGMAGYLHKIAVRRSEAGKGVPAVMIDWASKLAKQEGKKCLRLDCDLHPSLCAVYERLGFTRVDVFTASPPDRASFSVARYQLAL